MSRKDSTKSGQDTFLGRIARESATNLAAATRIVDWAKEHRLVRRYTSAERHDSLMCDLRLGQTQHKLFTLETDGHLWILFDQLASRFPERDVTAKGAFCDELKARVATLPGRVSDSPTGAQAAWNLEEIDLDRFLNVMEWTCRELARHHELTLASVRRRP